MPLTGDLTEFPLPEVLLLIGPRTGRLRLFDAQDFVPITVDITESCVQGLHVHNRLLSDPAQIVAELSFTMESGGGQFEFVQQPVVSIQRLHELPISELVMHLVMRVDEKLARHRAVLAPELFYVLITPAPLLVLEGDLLLFYRQSRHLLAGGVRCEDLAEYLGADDESTRLNLYDLHQQGIVRLVETTDVEALRESMIIPELPPETRSYQLEAKNSVLRRAERLFNLST